MSPSKMKKGDQYRKEFKDTVVSYAAKTSITQAAKKFSVHHTSIALWIHEKKHQAIKEDGDQYFETCGDLNIGKLCESSFIDWLSKNLSSLSYDSIKEQVNLLKLIYQNIPVWLSNYSERLNDPNYKNSSVHTLYPPQFKSLVVKFSDGSNLPQSHISKIFRVSRKQLSQWQKMFRLKGNLNKASRSSKKLLTSADVDEAIWKWYQSEPVPPSTNSVKNKALSLYHESGHMDMKCSYGWYYKWCARYKVSYKQRNEVIESQLIQWILEQLEQNSTPSHEDIRLKAEEFSANPNFKASPGWVLRFCRRNSLLFGNHLVDSSLLPSFLKEKFNEFEINLDKFVSENCLSTKAVVIVDEVVLDFKNSPGLIPQRVLENSPASCIIACDKAGVMLPLLLVLKDKTNKVEVIYDNIVVYHHTEDNPHESAFRYWLENIWFCHMTTPTLLLADSFKIHQNPWVQTMIDQNNKFIKIVPVSWVSLASPLGDLVSSVTESVHNQWRTFAKEGYNEINNTTVINWVSRAHDTTSRRHNNMMKARH